MNLFPDPGLANSQYTPNGSAIVKDGPSIVFADANVNDTIVTTNGNSETALGFRVRQTIARAGIYQASVFVADYVKGDGQIRARSGGTFPLGITGNGWSSPIEFNAGQVSTGLFLRGLDGGTFRIVPDENGEAIRITT